MTDIRCDKHSHKNVRSLALMVWERHCFEDIFKRVAEIINHLISSKYVCRIAPATPGLYNFFKLNLFLIKYLDSNHALNKLTFFLLL